MKRTKRLLVEKVPPHRHNRIVLNWTTPVGAHPAGNLHLYAEAFHRAGRLLGENYGKTGALADFEALPILYLYRHALELSFKAIVVHGEPLFRLRGNSGLRSDTKKMSGHRLSDFVEDFERIVEELSWDWDMEIDGLRSRQQFIELVAELDQIDPQSTAFRYPSDKKGRAALDTNFSFDLSIFCRRMDNLFAVLNGTVYALREQYSVETQLSNEGHSAW